MANKYGRKGKYEWHLVKHGELPIDMEGKSLRHWQQLAYQTGKRHGCRYEVRLDPNQPGFVLVSRPDADRPPPR